MKTAVVVTAATVLLCLGSLAQAASVKWVGNGHWYERVDVQLDWYDAETAAENQGGYLATITSSAEDEFILDNLGGWNIWLGGPARG